MEPDEREQSMSPAFEIGNLFGHPCGLGDAWKHCVVVNAWGSTHDDQHLTACRARWPSRNAGENGPRCSPIARLATQRHLSRAASIAARR